MFALIAGTGSYESYASSASDIVIVPRFRSRDLAKTRGKPSPLPLLNILFRTDFEDCDPPCKHTSFSVEKLSGIPDISMAVSGIEEIPLVDGPWSTAVFAS